LRLDVIVAVFAVPRTAIERDSIRLSVAREVLVSDYVGNVRRRRSSVAAAGAVKARREAARCAPSLASVTG